jgi:hypothetical protein
MKINLGQRIFIFSSLLGLSARAQCQSLSAETQSSYKIQQNSSFQNFSIFAMPEVNFVDGTSGAKLTKGAVALGVQFSFSRNWALAPSVRQSYSTQNNKTSAFYLAFDVNIVYALTGGLGVEETNTSVGGAKVYESRTKSEGGFRLELGMKQYFFNSPTTTVPFSGPGSLLYYHFPWNDVLGFSAGSGADLISNATTNLRIIRVFTRMEYLL